MKPKKLLSLVAGIVVVLTSVSVAFSQQSTDTKILQIGWLGSQTGWCSTNDILNLQGGQLARDMINERGGLTIKGQKYKIELLNEDCKCTTDGTVAGATKLVEDQHIKFIGGFAFWYAAAIKEVCDPAKVIRTLQFTCNTPGEMRDEPYNFLANNASYETALALMDYIKKTYPNIKKLVMITPDAGCQPYTIPPIRKWLEERGFTVVGKLILYPNQMTDFSPIAAQVVATKEADAIFMVNGLPIHSGNILRGLREQGDTRMYFVSSNNDPKELLRIAGKSAATGIFTIGPLPGAPGTPPLLTEINKRLIAKYGQAIMAQITGFNILWTMAYAIDKAQSLDTTTVKDTWENLKTVETAFGNGTMGGLKTYGAKHAVNHPCPIFKLENGEAKFVAWVETHTP